MEKLITPVEIDILEKLKPATTLVQLPVVLAEYWFTQVFKDTHVILVEKDEPVLDYSMQFFTPASNAGGSIDGCELRNSHKEVIGEYALNNGCFIQLTAFNIRMPLRQWEDEYVRHYNAKHNTQYLSFNQAYTLQHLQKQERERRQSERVSINPS